jgi:hypothetical protein
MNSYSFTLNIGITARDEEEALEIVEAIRLLVEHRKETNFKVDYVDAYDLEEC